MRTLVALTLLLLPALAVADVAGTGAYRTDVNIEVPALHGVEPTLRLSYDSSIGTGPLGTGWRLAGVSSITRVGTTFGVPHYDDSDTFSLDGTELIPCPSSSPPQSCRDGGTHVGRVDTFQRIVYDDNTDTWTIWDRDGRRLTYTAQLRASPSSKHTYRWALIRVEDTHGNTAWYDYNCSTGEECMPTTIRWGSGKYCGEGLPDTQPGTPLHVGEVIFHWQGRSDVTERTTGEALFTAAPMLLRAIEVRSAGAVQRAYVLDYDATHSAAHAAQLRSIDTYGANTQIVAGNVIGYSDKLPTQSFDTASMLRASAGWTGSTTTLPSNANASLPDPKGNEYEWKRSLTDGWIGDGLMKLRWLPGDVNGDGLTDYVLIGGIEVGVGLGQRDGTFVFSVDSWAHNGWTGASGVDPIQNVHTYIADFDGDGRGDVMQALDAYYCDAQCPCTLANSGVCRHTAFRVAKFNDDGSWDFHQTTTAWPYTPNQTWSATIGYNFSISLPFSGVSASFDVASGVIWNSTSTFLWDNWYVGDFDGDGRADFMGVSPYIRTRPDGSTEHAVRLRAVRSLGDSVNTVETTTDTDWNYDFNNSKNSRFLVGDHDGDGRADFMVAHLIPASGSTPHRLAFATGRSNGDGTFTTAVMNTTRDWDTEDQWLPGDVNGDGRTDFMHITHLGPSGTIRWDHASVEAAVSDGEGNYFFTSSTVVNQQWHFPGPCVGQWQAGPWFPADVDGDGRTDLVHAYINHDYDCATEDSWYIHGGVVYSRPGGTFVVGNDLPRGGPWNPGCGQEITLGVGDFNGDGREDFVFGDSIPSIRDGCWRRFWALEYQPTPLDTKDALNWKTTDLNGDGREDLYYVTYENPDYRVYSLIANANGGYSRFEYATASALNLQHLDHPAADRWMSVDVGDGTPNGRPDGKEDLVYIDEKPDDDEVVVTTLFSYGSGTFLAKQFTLATAGELDASVLRIGWRVADIDGDGRADFVHIIDSRPGTRIDVLRSRGNGDYDWSHDTYLTATRLRDTQSWRVGDFDGDGRSDLTYVRRIGGFNEAVMLFSLGDGTFDERFGTLPTWFIDSRNWRTAQLNGDNLTDLVYLEEQRTGTSSSVIVHGMISIGDGQFEYRASSPIPVTGATLHDRKHFRVVDIDGDGRSELVHVGVRATSGTASTTVVSTLWNRHDGWSLQVSPTIPFGFTDVGSWRLMDRNADGTTDLVYVTSDLQWLTADIPGDRLARQRNGIGGQLDIHYKSSAGSHAFMPGGTTTVVDQIDVSENVVAGGIVGSERYTYTGALWSIARRQFLGFESITRADGSGSLATTHYEQKEACGVRPLSREVRDQVGSLFGSTHVTYVTPSTSGDAPYVCLPWIDEAFECERSAPCRLTRTIHEFDAWGNEVRTNALGDVADATDDKLIETPVHPNLVDYVVSKPAYQRSYGLDANGKWEVLAGVNYYYDGATVLGSHPGSRADVTMVEAWDNQTNRWIPSTFAYDTPGNITSVTGPPTPHAPNGHNEVFTYDCTFSLYPMQRCNGKFCVNATWDLALGVKKTETDANNQTTMYSHDAFGRQIRTDRPDRSFMATQYAHQATYGTNSQSTHEEVSDESPVDGVLSRDVFFDGLGRTTRLVMEDGTTSLIEYQGATSKPHRQSAPYRWPMPVQWTTSDYDETGRLIRTTLPDNSVYRATIEPGRVWERDPMGGTTGYVRDGFGRTTDVIEVLQTCPVGVTECAARNVTTKYKYDALDRLLAVTDAKGNVSRTTWDSLDGKVEACNPDSGCWHYEYNDDGTLARQQDANKEAIELSYDELGRPTEKRYYDTGGSQVRTVNYAWDVDPTTNAPAGASIGRRVRVEDRGGNTDIVDTSEYDVLGREQLHERCLDAHCMQWKSELDLGGRLRRFHYPDAAGKVSPSSEVVEYNYAPTGRLESMPGFVDHVDYDVTGALQQIRFANGAVEDYVADPKRAWLMSKDVTDSNGTKALHLEYTYDRKGRVTSHTFSNATSASLTYWYDSLDRLLVVGGAAPFERHFAYDDIGNLTLDARYGDYTYGDPDHVHAVTATKAGHRRRYDNRGNLLESEKLDLVWNQDGMPTEITNRSTGATTELGYDESGHRVKMSTRAGIAYYFSPLVEIEPSGDVATTYMMGDRLIARRTTKGLMFFHEDVTGSIRALTDTKGVVQNRYDYGAFGDVVSRYEPLDNDFLFAQSREDDTINLNYMGARYYDPELGTFIAADTVVPGVFNPQALNRYSYGFNSPTNFADPSGHAPNHVGSDQNGRPIEMGTYELRNADDIRRLKEAMDKYDNEKTKIAKPKASPTAPKVEIVDLDAVLQAGKDEAMRTVGKPILALIGGTVALGAIAVAGSAAAASLAAESGLTAGSAIAAEASALLARAGTALSGAPGAIQRFAISEYHSSSILRWYLKASGSAAGRTAIVTALGANLYGQSTKYTRNPQSFEFDATSFVVDGLTAPITSEVFATIGAAYPMFKPNPFFADGIGPRVFVTATPGSLLAGNLAAASYLGIAAYVRSASTDTALDTNLENAAIGYGWGGSRAMLLEYLAMARPDLFPLGRRDPKLVALNRALTIALSALKPPPTNNGGKR